MIRVGKRNFESKSREPGAQWPERHGSQRKTERNIANPENSGNNESSSEFPSTPSREAFPDPA